MRSIAATPAEQARVLPGDALIPDAFGWWTHAVTIHRPRTEVWPWLIQMGAGTRAGWYSYDFLDNGRRRSAAAVIPALQNIGVGTLFPALPGVTDGFHVLELEPNRSLVLGFKSGPDKPPTVTWSFALEDLPNQATRLIVRARGGREYSFYGLPRWIGIPVIRLVHFIMQRKQLLTIASLVEAHGRAGEVDSVLDDFMPQYDVVERHAVRVKAPPEVTLEAAKEADLRRSPIIRGIFRGREIILRATADRTVRPKGLLDETLSLGWRVLAERPAREVVVGAVTQPWNADVVFRGLGPREFKEFCEPGYVRIAWTLRVDPEGPDSSIFRTETRVAATDAAARARFRWYWTRFSPGIVLIRRLLLRELKADAERRVGGGRAAVH